MIWKAGDPMPVDQGWNFLVGYLEDPAGNRYQILLNPEPENGPDQDVAAEQAEYDANQPKG